MIIMKGLIAFHIYCSKEASSEHPRRRSLCFSYFYFLFNSQPQERIRYWRLLMDKQSVIGMVSLLTKNEWSNISALSVLSIAIHAFGLNKYIYDLTLTLPTRLGPKRPKRCIFCCCYTNICCFFI